MLRKSLMLTFVSLSIVAASFSSQGGHAADMEAVVNQKKVMDLLMYVEGNTLTDTEYFEVGRSYDIVANIERYNDKRTVLDFLIRHKLGMLRKDALFSHYNQEHREEMTTLYQLLCAAKDFATFYKTACWARLHMNTGMFICAFTSAITARDDTKYISLPAIYEIFPEIFFDSTVIREAQRIAMTHGSSNINRGMDIRKADVSDSVETYHLQANSSCSNACEDCECQLCYFTEDVGLNAYYYYYRMMYPFWVKTKEQKLPENVRGDLYYFLNQQLKARYNLERISNGMGELKDFSWNEMSLPGFYSNIVYNNGVAMPQRNWWNKTPCNKNKYLEYLQQLEARISEAIDSGYIVDETGKQVSLTSNDGLNMLGNLIEGNADSRNVRLYGAYEVLARNVLGANVDNDNKNFYVPSSLQLFATSLRDPAFYRMCDKITGFFLRYKSLLNRYTKNEVEFSGVKIENVDVDKLVTYFDTKDYLINNAVDVASMKDGFSFNIKTWKLRLNCKPFTYKININSDRSTNAVVRIFLGPAAGAEKYDEYSYLLQNYQNFYQLDEFEANLREGINTIDRHSTESQLFNNEYTTGDRFYKKIMQAIQGKEPFTFNSQKWGFPQNLQLPKGSADGVKYKLFVHVGPRDNSQVTELPILGARINHGKPLGFPLDRPIQPWFCSLNNVYFKDVVVYNIDESGVAGGSNYNPISNYQNVMRHQDPDVLKLEQMKESDSIRGNSDDSNAKNSRRAQDWNMMHI